MGKVVRYAAAVTSSIVLAGSPGWQAAEGGGEPSSVPSTWVSVRAVPGADVLEAIPRIPRDLNPLGVGPAPST